MRGETCLARAEHLQGPIPARQHARDVARHACTLFTWHVLPVQLSCPYSTAPVRVLAGVPTCECQHAENFVCTDRSNFSTAPVGTQIMYSELLTVPARPRAML